MFSHNTVSNTGTDCCPACNSPAPCLEPRNNSEGAEPVVTARAPCGCGQVMTLGAPVTSLSLSPAMDMLATAHVNRRGIYLWSNQVRRGFYDFGFRVLEPWNPRTPNPTTLES